MKNRRSFTRFVTLLLAVCLFVIGLPFGTAAATTTISEGSYYLRNQWTLYYLTITDDYPTVTTTLKQQELTREHTQVWEFVSTGDGYCAIRSKCRGISGTEYYLTAYSTGAGTEIQAEYVLNYTQTSSLQRWKFVETDSGNYKIVNKYWEASDYVLALKTPEVSGGFTELPIHLAKYINNTGMIDEWSLIYLG